MSVCPSVLQGAQDILNELPVEYVEPPELQDVSQSGGTGQDPRGAAGQSWVPRSRCFLLPVSRQT